MLDLVSSLCAAHLLSGLGKADCSSGTKSWMLLQKYLVAGREQRPHGLVQHKMSIKVTIANGPGTFPWSY